MFVLNGLNDGVVMHLVPSALVPSIPNASTPTITQTPITPGTTATIDSAKPWYKTWWGIGGLAALGLLAYRRFKK